MTAILVLTTCPNLKIAKKIAKHLVSKRLAACVQIGGPVKSVYRWKGQVCEETELQLFIKTQTTHFKSVSKEISLLHPYEVPEIISISIDQGSENYLKWLKSEVTNVRIHSRSSK